jgi:hypothetical protein
MLTVKTLRERSVTLRWLRSINPTPPPRCRRPPRSPREREGEEGGLARCRGAGGLPALGGSRRASGPRRDSTPIPRPQGCFADAQAVANGPVVSATPTVYEYTYEQPRKTRNEGLHPQRDRAQPPMAIPHQWPEQPIYGWAGTGFVDRAGAAPQWQILAPGEPAPSTPTAISAQPPFAGPDNSRQ